MEFHLRIALFTIIFGKAMSEYQRLVLYDQVDEKGESIVIRSNDYTADLANLNFDNRPYSVCVTGIWLFYQDTNFNPFGGRGVDYAFGFDNSCVNLQSSVAGTISSVRYAGAPTDFTIDSLTLYEYDYFQGNEEYTLTSRPNLEMAERHGSIIITGNSNWTIYDQVNYQGHSVCLRVSDPGSRTPMFIADLQKLEPPIPHGSIRSIMRGCPSEPTTVFRFTRQDYFYLY